MSFVWLATCADLPDGGDERVLPAMFAQRGVSAEWAQWDDRSVDWGRADLVAIRTTWDYATRIEEFLGWTREVSDLTRLVNHADIVSWNTDKTYLCELSQWGLPTVPTTLAEDTSELRDLIPSYAAAVIKPQVGVGGIGLVVWHRGEEPPPIDGPVVVQPLVESVRTSGEVSIFVMAGRAVGQVVKHPVAGEVRVHEEYGGSKVAVDVEPSLTVLAERAIALTCEHFRTAVPYGRVDLLHHEGTWVVSELEITEPGLYVEVDTAVAEAYVDAITALL
jgi:glutathione synthase/RimK-type ligase-like ATP-grasp enzyme